MDQAPFQLGTNTGAADDDTTVRRVTVINDVQFGKGTIYSEEGVAGFGDLRGAFNLVKLSVSPN